MKPKVCVREIGSLGPLWRFSWATGPHAGMQVKLGDQWYFKGTEAAARAHVESWGYEVSES